MENKGELAEPGLYRKGTLDLVRLASDVTQRLCDGKPGAISTFLGVVKSEGEAGKTVSSLEIEAYEEYAGLQIKRICEDIREKYGLDFVGIWHLAGSFIPGEPLVLVVIAGRSRKEVFPALEEAVRRYKTEPPLFKKEVYADGTHKWIGHDGPSPE